MNISIIEGNIVKAKVDAIVNAANPMMLGGGGVDGAIHEAAGPELIEECRKVKSVNGIRCPFGHARITKAGNLSSKYVIHTSGPIYRNETDPAKVLSSCYMNSLSLATEYGCKSIAFPAISCGAYGYPLEAAAKIAFEICTNNEYRSMNIYFYLRGKKIFDAWLSIYNEHFT
jgi:O-acetyl-ADP-ribose deacetylase